MKWHCQDKANQRLFLQRLQSLSSLRLFLQFYVILKSNHLQQINSIDLCIRYSDYLHVQDFLTTLCSNYYKFLCWPLRISHNQKFYFPDEKGLKKNLEIYIFFPPHKNPWCLLVKTALQSQNFVLCVLSLAVSFLSPWRLQCQSYYRQIHQMACQIMLIPFLISEWAFTSSEVQEGCEIKFRS